MKEHLKSRAHKLGKHYDIAQSRIERAETEPCLQERGSCERDQALRKTDEKRPVCEAPPAHEEAEASQGDAAGFRMKEEAVSSVKCNPVLFVERSGEPQYQEWLSA